MKGKAQRWFHSNLNHLNLSVEDLLKEMKKMYGRETNCLVRRKKFDRNQDRIWKRDETFTDYYHEKTILANQVPISANEIVSYLIRGIPNKNMRNQIRLQKFATDVELLEAMEDISLPSPFKSEAKKDGRLRHNGSGKSEGATHHRACKQEAVEKENATRCYNCGETGHIATKCTKPKWEKGACYICGKNGISIKRVCRQRKERQEAQRTSTQRDGKGTKRQ